MKRLIRSLLKDNKRHPLLKKNHKRKNNLKLKNKRDKYQIQNHHLLIQILLLLRVIHQIQEMKAIHLAQDIRKRRDKPRKAIKSKNNI